MHMADALVSPAVGGTMWAVSAGIIGWCSRSIKNDADDRLIPLMGVLGAFIFAAQMINFTIPATGSSGHIGGGLFLAVLLGPAAAFLTIASILTVQALFFADGGILALGCNIFNLGFFPCLVAYPLIYKPLVRTALTPARIIAASLLAAGAGLQLGSLGVVVQTLLSGVTELPLSTFLLFMQPVHLAIGLVEGLATASLILFIARTRPDILELPDRLAARPRGPLRGPLLLFFTAALLTGCILSLFASGLPDGLEWSIMKSSGHETLAAPAGHIHETFAGVQEKAALLPDYDFRHPAAGSSGTTVAGFVGSAITLLFAGLLGLLLRRRKHAAS
jgi:cobalt/nickel transport system permease protein